MPPHLSSRSFFSAFAVPTSSFSPSPSRARNGLCRAVRIFTSTVCLRGNPPDSLCPLTVASPWVIKPELWCEIGDEWKGRRGSAVRVSREKLVLETPFLRRLLPSPLPKFVVAAPCSVEADPKPETTPKLKPKSEPW
ncbi:hypothetical protein Nepgr_020327 [Nepenthes gracilis]|uniref:Uncharacterized protein n=1 Tax=Nepenthes gracilis TaxID=150966 RepID=A0AAD3SYV1_NEPGR|nr:hypothetical protein Nepgr_020327 [Nepenthes gracilis]